ncbi:hypothetical protein H6P81_001195 [Aristolochia fimbriata]|uniref:Uncharacterized protein n=1 Tax=Aristolochia fimbriata TaxID=158543 RepID=A0AAV7F9H5_ARIFI|nr:hypothetical protein H6P81_001195 [Aristolochia fimbriata]
MKASVKFRDEQNTLLRAKIPISVLGLPFLSGITAGESKELSLSLGTFFESGPSFKVSYRPNDSWNPFALVLKTGIGSFGSPISVPMTISTEFSLLGRGNPTFFLRLKPQMGDFSIKKTAASAIVLPAENPVFGRKAKAFERDHDTDGEGSVDGGETPKPNGGNGAFHAPNGDYAAERRNGFLAAPGVHTAGAINGLFSGVEVNTRSVLPLKNHLRLKFRWGVRFPAELRDIFPDGRRRNPTADISFKKIPLLVINKISIEHVAEEAKSKSSGLPAASDVSDTCQSFKRQLEFLQAENGVLRKAVEELRSEISTPASPIEARSSPKHDREKEKAGRKPTAGKKDRRNEEKPPDFGSFAGKPIEDDPINEELKKALTSAIGAGK